MTESQFQQTVIALARTLNWKVAHFRGVRVQRRDGTTRYQTPVQADGAGFPDLVLVKDGRIIFAELKVGYNKTSEAQREWLDELARNKYVGVYLWKPSDWDEIEEALR